MFETCSAGWLEPALAESLGVLRTAERYEPIAVSEGRTLVRPKKIVHRVSGILIDCSRSPTVTLPLLGNRLRICSTDGAYF